MIRFFWYLALIITAAFLLSSCGNVFNTQNAFSAWTRTCGSKNLTYEVKREGKDSIFIAKCAVE